MKNRITIFLLSLLLGIQHGAFSQISFIPKINILTYSKIDLLLEKQTYYNKSVALEVFYGDPLIKLYDYNRQMGFSIHARSYNNNAKDLSNPHVGAYLTFLNVHRKGELLFSYKDSKSSYLLLGGSLGLQHILKNNIAGDVMIYASIGYKISENPTVDYRISSNTSNLHLDAGLKIFAGYNFLRKHKSFSQKSI